MHPELGMQYNRIYKQAKTNLGPTVTEVSTQYLPLIAKTS